MHNKRVALVTGANKGIGLQIAKDLAGNGFTVLLGSRSLVNGQEAAKTIKAGAHAVQLDVTSQSSINAVAELIERDFGRLDVLVNNAGISHSGKEDVFGAGKQKIALEEIAKSGLLTAAPLQEVRDIFETNVFGVIAVTKAMLPLLLKAPAGRIVNVASSGASITLNSDPNNPHRRMFGAYSTSKAAAHAVTFAFAMALESTKIKVNAACPGFTKTALNNFQGIRSVEEAAREPVRLALLDENGPTGTFSNEDGQIPW